jgi:AcrR family transcriptional regulator
MGIANTTRERILDKGLAMASQSGLEAVTLGVLASNVGMSKSGLFAHFHSKEAVQLGLLEHSDKFAVPVVVQPAMKAPEGLPRLRALVTNWFGWAQRAGLPGGCPVAAGLFEYDDVQGIVHDKIKEIEARWRALLSSFVAQAVAHGHLTRDLDIDQFVWELFGIYLSHHVASRFLKSKDADRRAQTAFAALLARAGAKELSKQQRPTRSRIKASKVPRPLARTDV